MRFLLFAGLFFLVACQQLGETISLDELSVNARAGDQAAISKLVGLLGSEGELTNDRIYALLVSLKSDSVVPALLTEVSIKLLTYNVYCCCHKPAMIGWFFWGVS